MLQVRSRVALLKAWMARLGIVLLVTGCATSAPLAQSDFAESPADDPPARVGRISFVAGPVRLTDLRDNDSDTAAINWPITSQHRVSTGRTGRAEIRIGSLAVRIDDESDVDFVRVDDEAIQIVLHRGSIAVRVRNRELLRELDLMTPRERIALEDVGRYRIDVDRASGITAVTTLTGYARIGAGPMSFVVQSGQRGEVSGRPATSFQLVSYAPDSFDDWVGQRDHRDDVVQSRRYVSDETTGVDALDAYGNWRQVDTYGSVWFPSSIPSDWAPYRHGRWAWIAPWGWTWIDEAPWGFAPSHYGRWVFIDGYWGWAPGLYVARPVYSPALVGWFGSPGVSVSVSVGQPVGWFPLGWREVYVPCYPVSRRYVNYINAGHVINITQITVIQPPVRFIHQRPGHSTWAPGDALTRRLPVNRVVQNAPADWTRLPTRVQPPMVVSGERSRKRIVSTSLAPSDIARPQPGDRVVAPTPRAPAAARPPERTPATDDRAHVGRPNVPRYRSLDVVPQPKTPDAPVAPSAPAQPSPTPGVQPGVRPQPTSPQPLPIAPDPRVGPAQPDASRGPKRGAGPGLEPNAPAPTYPPSVTRPQPRGEMPRQETPRAEPPRPMPRAIEPPRPVEAPRAAPPPRIEAPRMEPPRERVEPPRQNAQPKPRQQDDDRPRSGGRQQFQRER